jgi:hypothetical protein
MRDKPDRLQRAILFATRLLEVGFLQSHFLRDVVELFVCDGLELFAARLELFVYLDGLLGHLLVGFLRAADEREIRAGRQPLVTVGIQTDAEHQCFFLFRRAQH